MNRSSSVLLCISSLHYGGAQKIFSLLCTRAQGYTPLVVSFLHGKCADMLRSSGVPVFVLARMPWKKDSLLGQCFLLFRLLRRERVFATIGFLPLGGILAAIAGAFLRVAFIYAIRSSLSYFTFRRGFVRAVLHRICLFAADRALCNSSVAARKLDRSSTDFIPNAIAEPSLQTRTDSDILRTYFGRKETFHVSIVCTMRYPPKDVFSVLKAARELPEVEFIFAGGGKSLPAFRATAAELGLRNAVFAGPQENVYPFYHYSDAYLLLSEDEGFPNTILEAMICKKPIIASRLPELEEILEDGRTALLVPNRDVKAIIEAVSRLRSDEELREGLAQRAYETAQRRYGVEAMIRAYSALFAATAKGGGSLKLKC